MEVDSTRPVLILQTKIIVTMKQQLHFSQFIRTKINFRLITIIILIFYFSRITRYVHFFNDFQKYS